MYTQSSQLTGKHLAGDGGGGIVVHTVLSADRQTPGWECWWWDCCTHSPLTWQANSWLGMVVVGLLYIQSSHLAGKLLSGYVGGGIVVHTVLSPGRQTPGWEWWWWDCCTYSPLTWQANSWPGMVVVGLLYTQNSHLAGKTHGWGWDCCTHSPLTWQAKLMAGGVIVVHTVFSPGRQTPG